MVVGKLILFVLRDMLDVRVVAHDVAPNVRLLSIMRLNVLR